MDQVATAHNSLALGLLLRQLPGERKPQVLDLGPAVSANIEFLSGLGCRFWVADLFRTLKSRDPESLPGDLGSFDRLLSRHLPTAGTEGFDLILAWDLFNYFRREELKVLGRHLARICRPHGSLFAMISIARQIPDQPLRFSISDTEQLLYGGESSHRRAAPQYKQPDLEKLMPGFEVETSFLLRIGIQEYVLARMEEPDESAYRFDPAEY